ncbi:hypothetical protein BH23PLA1_BH23PLA1_13530 [soil metagenome]
MKILLRIAHGKKSSGFGIRPERPEELSETLSDEIALAPASRAARAALPAARVGKVPVSKVCRIPPARQTLRLPGAKRPALAWLQGIEI